MGLTSRRLPLVAAKFIATCEKIENGTLRLITPQKDVLVFGHGAPEAELQINDWCAISAMATRGEIGVGEAYSDGAWDSPDVDVLTRVICLNEQAFQSQFDGSYFSRLTQVFIDKFLRRNTKSGSRSNIHAHYDVGNAFYQLWLDETMTYSSALFATEADTLETAQNRKYDKILSSLNSSGARTLEVGCGWGGFAERAAEHGRDVTGISISPSQISYARERLGRRASVKLQDYRDVKGVFDSIVSIEMIEAVGERYWPTYFRFLKDRLSKTGSAILQVIVVDDDYFPTYRKRSDYIRHYIFPGGMLLSPKCISEQASRAGLKVADTFHFGTHYERTLQLWYQRFKDNEMKIRALGYDEAFLRSWKFYLQICAGSFGVRQTDVVHVKLAHA